MRLEYSVLIAKAWRGLRMKRVILLFCGAAWLLIGGGGFLLLLARYVAEVCGWEIFGLGISSGGALLGMGRLIGLFAGMVLCFAIGLLFFARGIVPPDRQPVRK
jgi:hypothetical protein